MENLSLMPLPIDDFISEILKKFSEHRNLVLVAEPGAGKTTRVPPALLKAVPQKILVLEPRRMAALAAATRISQEQNFILGADVGYQVRYENKTTPKTRLIFMTEALLAKKILQSPTLEGVDVVLLDEFHERSQHVDLALGLLREAQELGSAVKIIIMSATLDAEKISDYLGNAPIIRVPGKSFPLEIKYDKFPQSLRADDKFYQRLITRIKEASHQSSDDILVFLPGVGEIHRCARELQDSDFSRRIDHLHGSLSIDEQRRVLKKSDLARVILSTNIAESSVTIDGVGVVIDSGLNKINSWNPETGFESLLLSRISQSSATQRAGRAARQGPGLCYRLWNAHDEFSMKPFTEAEILRVDLSDAILWLASLGVPDPETFTWYQCPPTRHLNLGKILLIDLGALDKNGRLTEKGRRILSLPLSLRLASVFFELEKMGFAEAADIAAILQERDIWSQNYDLQNFHENHENELYLRYELFEAFKNKGSDPSFAQNLIKARQQLRNLLSFVPEKKAMSLADLQIALLNSFPDRICRRRNPKESKALMANGRGVELDVKSMVKKADFFIALSGLDLNDKDTRITMAAALTKDQILSYFSDQVMKSRQLKQDPSNGKIWVEELKYFRKIPLEKPVVRAASAEEVQKLLPALMATEWKQVLKSLPELQNWHQRWNYYVSTKKIQDPLVDLLPQIIEQGTVSLNSWDQAIKQNWIYLLELNLPPQFVQEFQKSVPAQLSVGPRHLDIQYESGQDPFIEAKLQFFFGLKTHPQIWNQSIPLRLILLGPHGRPVQITKDLVGFWKSSYFEIRKELKPDYPKHNWPDDPTLAEEPLKRKSR